MQDEQVEFDHNRNMLIESKLLKKNNSHNEENTQIIIQIQLILVLYYMTSYLQEVSC